MPAHLGYPLHGDKYWNTAYYRFFYGAKEAFLKISRGWQSRPMATVVRRYNPEGNDRIQINSICCDSAFLGNPIDPIFMDRSWFARNMILPYLILEPDYTWVVDTGGGVVGYLTASVTPVFGYLRAYMVATNVLLELIPNYVLGKYDHHPRSKRFAEFVITNGLSQIPRHPQNAAHFHFNIHKDYRGQGLGKRLLGVFEESLSSRGIERYYAEVMSSPTWRPEPYFTRLGYKIYDKVKTTVFEPEVEDLYVLCVIRDLTLVPRQGEGNALSDF